MRRLFSLAVLIAALFGGGVPLAGCEPPASSGPAAEVWQCPMHPKVVQDHPGDCPICGMRLVEIGQRDDEATAEPTATTGEVPGRATVVLDASRQQRIGLRTAPVVLDELRGGFTTSARVVADPDRVRKVSVKVGGTVERVTVDAVGRRVRRGTALFSLFSPDLQVAQDELLLALRTRDALGAAGAADPGTLVDAARRKLHLLDVPDSEIARIEAAREPLRTLTFTSPADGLVTARDVVEGDMLAPGDVPFEITGLESVWVLADARQSDLARVEPGQPAVLTVDAYPGRVWDGRVAVVEPALDAGSRTARIHIHLDNPDGVLLPDMFGRVALSGEPRSVLVIPVDAVLPAGTRDLVFVAAGEGRFAPRIVTLGVTEGDRVEVLAGLQAGEEVVTRANFLVDSESSLRSALSAME